MPGGRFELFDTYGRPTIALEHLFLAILKGDLTEKGVRIKTTNGSLYVIFQDFLQQLNIDFKAWQEFIYHEQTGFIEFNPKLLEKIRKSII